MIRPNLHVAAMAPYALSARDTGPGARIALDQNESLRPPCPNAVAASAALHLYPDPGATALCAALAEAHGVAPEKILCGAGSLDLINALARAYAGPARAVLIPAHAYPFFATAGAMTDARVDRAAEQDWRISVDALLAAVVPDTSLVFLANPGNPTGTAIPVAELIRLRAGLRDDILLVIDEAYGEFHGETAMGLAGREDVVILRTFSKAYGLAGARVGWGIFPAAVAGELRKLLNPNAVSGPAQAAANAALADQAYMHETVAMTVAARDTAQAALHKARVPVVPSHTNFLLLPFETAQQAARIAADLRARGILLRPQSGVGLPQALRLTIGAEACTMTAVRALIKAYQEAQT